jgi:hypothetical protein
MSAHTKSGASGLQLVEFKQIDKGVLVGFATVDVPIGRAASLRIHDIGVFRMGEKAWANLPAKPLVGRDGTPILDKKSGKPRYSAILEWNDRPTADRFSAAVVALVEASRSSDVG